MKNLSRFQWKEWILRDILSGLKNLAIGLRSRGRYYSGFSHGTFVGAILGKTEILLIKKYEKFGFFEDYLIN